MTTAVRAVAAMLGLAVLVSVWMMYRTPVMGMVLSVTAFCQ